MKCKSPHSCGSFCLVTLGWEERASGSGQGALWPGGGGRGGGEDEEDEKDGGEEDEDEHEHEDYMDNGQVYCHWHVFHLTDMIMTWATRRKRRQRQGTANMRQARNTVYMTRLA